ncbi:MAG: hypothetical protein H3C35_10010 [Bacteroidetes bacterium]|nr:hypothetical protein [Bacteroidota bacterium]
MNILFAFLLLMKLTAAAQDSSSAVVVEDMLGSFDDAASLSIAPNGIAFVADKHSSKIYSLSFHNQQIRSFGGSGWGEYAFDTPVDVTATFLLELFVVDRNNRRVQQFDRTLNFVQSYDENLDARTIGKFLPQSAAISRAGNLFILELDGKRILKLNGRKQIEKIFGIISDGKGRLQMPIDLSITDANQVFVLDDYTVKMYDEYGNYISSVLLKKDTKWKTLSTFSNGFLVTSPQEILLFSNENTLLSTLQMQNFFGMNSEERFVDAALVDTKLYVLTQHHLYRCSIQP